MVDKIAQNVIKKANKINRLHKEVKQALKEIDKISEGLEHDVAVLLVKFQRYCKKYESLYKGWSFLELKIRSLAINGVNVSKSKNAIRVKYDCRVILIPLDWLENEKAFTQARIDKYRDKVLEDKRRQLAELDKKMEEVLARRAELEQEISK
ncbi:hypothetical protein [Vibrio phage JSF12]|uniref:Uncharacterized protein n=2 Tax=Jesfedecavirus TaxID=2560156 RepID=A0A2D0YXN6_9CAUD|nr:hypothetical protein FDI98_gp028 [Vibrio phage JSF10]YP_009794759.1 hypothetical protein HOS35_gp076 [Vibrio phage JSF12]ASV43504.1 hypothetical protein [Vibrio phage JSF10]ASV43594.1 hypothetical protein [Vibrio phage JSF12]